jgi:SAM-dependent methyltransferase
VFLNKIHPERAVSGSTKHDGTLKFYSFVKTIMCDLDAQRVMDFGAGRGAPLEKEERRWRRDLMDLRQYGAEVYACDIDSAVNDHAWSDHQIILGQGQLPFMENFFDLIVSDVTFEHVQNPKQVAGELCRVLKPGGVICVRTPNKYGYPALITRLVPNRLHASAIRHIQPGGRQEHDVFPTAFKMNSVRAIRRLFPSCEIYWYRDSAEPSYYFGNHIIYRLMLALHKWLPEIFGTSLCLFIRKPKNDAREVKA